MRIHLFAITCLATSVDISRAAPVTHLRAHRSPANEFGPLTQWADDMASALRNGYRRIQEKFKHVGEGPKPGKWVDNPVYEEPKPGTWVDNPVYEEPKPGKWVDNPVYEEPRVMANKKAGSQGWSKSKIIAIGGATLLATGAGVFALNSAFGDVASGDEPTIDAEAYMRENPSEAHELVKVIRGLEGIDQETVKKLEKIASEVAPQAAKRSLLDLD